MAQVNHPSDPPIAPAQTGSAKRAIKTRAQAHTWGKSPHLCEQLVRDCLMPEGVQGGPTWAVDSLGAKAKGGQ